VAVINASVPVAREPGHNDGPGVSGLVPRNTTRPPEPDKDRFARMNIKKIEIGAEPETKDDSKSVFLNLQIRSDAFVLSAGGSHPYEELKELTVRIPARDGTLDFAALAASAKEIHDRYPQSATVIVLPDDHVPYQAVVSAMDAVRDQVVDRRTGQLELLFPQAVISRIIPLDTRQMQDRIW